MKKRITLLITAMLTLATLSACGASGADYAPAPSAPMETSSSNSTRQMAGAVVSDEAYLMPEAEAYAYDTATADDGSYDMPADASMTEEQMAAGDLDYRKLIRNANLNVETREFDDLLVAIDERVKALGGYMESYNVNSNSYYDHLIYGGDGSRYAYMNIRIPARHYDTFMNTVTAISNVTNRSESVSDVTLQYVDIESHKKVLEAEQKRLIELIEKADDIDSIIRIERRLSEVRYQIESRESQLRMYDNLVDYSSIHINISEVKELTPVVEQSVWERIASGFTSSLKRVGIGLQNFFVWLIVASPFLVTYAIVVALIMLIAKVGIAHGKKKRAKKAEKLAERKGEMEP